LKRGDIVLVREPRTPAGKARPCIVVQRDSALPFAAKVSVCPLTSQLRGAVGQRPLVVPALANGLSKPSEVQVDWVYTFPREFIGDRIGSVDEPTLEQVDIALRRWLDL
jgi:mRNA interferase MazF